MNYFKQQLFTKGVGAWRTASIISGNAGACLGWDNDNYPTPNDNVNGVNISGPKGDDSLDNWTLVNTNIPTGTTDSSGIEASICTASVKFRVFRIAKIHFDFYTDLDDPGDEVTFTVKIKNVTKAEDTYTYYSLGPGAMTHKYIDVYPGADEPCGSQVEVSVVLKANSYHSGSGVSSFCIATPTRITTS